MGRIKSKEISRVAKKLTEFFSESAECLLPNNLIKSGYNDRMFQLTPFGPVDYVVIGHLTKDLTPQGPRLGGTAAYSALTARALGMRAGIVTAWAADLPLGPLQAIPVASYPAEASSTFENVITPRGRLQYVRAIAPPLEPYHVPEPWRSAPIVHLGPIAREVAPGLGRAFPSSLVCITPQGWFRSWDNEGFVHHVEWPEASYVLERADAAVISVEDVDGDEERVAEMAASCRVFAVTDGPAGSRVFWNGDVRKFQPPEMVEVDPVGAGDIFAAAFFTRFYQTRDPWEAGRFATQLSAYSVLRPGLAGVPTADEIASVSIEVY